MMIKRHRLVSTSPASLQHYVRDWLFRHVPRLYPVEATCGQSPSIIDTLETDELTDRATGGSQGGTESGIEIYSLVIERHAPCHL